MVLQQCSAHTGQLPLQSFIRRRFIRPSPGVANGRGHSSNGKGRSHQGLLSHPRGWIRLRALILLPMTLLIGRQRFLQLRSTYTIDMNSGNATLHVSQLPGSPGPTLFQPGPALIFLVVDNVPSIGQWIMVGTGELGQQPIQADAPLPASQIKAVQNVAGKSAPTGAVPSIAASTSKSAAGRLASPLFPPTTTAFTFHTLLVGLCCCAAVIAWGSVSI